MNNPDLPRTPNCPGCNTGGIMPHSEICPHLTLEDRNRLYPVTPDPADIEARAENDPRWFRHVTKTVLTCLCCGGGLMVRSEDVDPAHLHKTWHLGRGEAPAGVEVRY